MYRLLILLAACTSSDEPTSWIPTPAPDAFTGAAVVAPATNAECIDQLQAAMGRRKRPSTEQAATFFACKDARNVQPWRPPDPNQIPMGDRGDAIRRGISLLTRTPEVVGPHAIDVDNRHAGNNLTCIHCHKNGPEGLPGTAKYMLPYVNVANDYPTLDPKSMTIVTLRKRILGMFGTGEAPLSVDDPELDDIVAYFDWLAEGSNEGAAMEGTHLMHVDLPGRAADPERGKSVFFTRCIGCHMPDGIGMRSPAFKRGGGYVFPPIAGEDTWSDGGHMTLLGVLTPMVLGSMPQGATPGAPLLTVEQAYDVAAYVAETLPRAHDWNRDTHYPDPAFRPDSWAPRELFSDETEWRRARFGPFSLESE